MNYNAEKSHREIFNVEEFLYTLSVLHVDVLMCYVELNGNLFCCCDGGEPFLLLVWLCYNLLVAMCSSLLLR